MATTLYKARLNDAKQQLMNPSPGEMEQEEDIFEPLDKDES